MVNIKLGTGKTPHTFGKPPHAFGKVTLSNDKPTLSTTFLGHFQTFIQFEVFLVKVNVYKNGNFL